MQDRRTRTNEPDPETTTSDPGAANPTPSDETTGADTDTREARAAAVEKITGRVREARDRIKREISKVIVGQERVVDDLLIALLGRGHCLLVGVPGLAKTLMVRTLADALDLDFNRIQFTPDLMPADIIGTDVLEEDPVTRRRTYKFLHGPVFTNILLADEINRTPPKTQAALLEAMQEYRVTAGGNTYEIEPPPFFVLATQNPIEQEGTYPLPEAQLDRFMFMLKIDYPSRREEVEILRATTLGEMARAEVCMKAEEVLRLQTLVRKIPVSDYIYLYAADLARASRPCTQAAPAFVNDFVTWGAGPRAAQYLVLGAKVHALLDGRVHVALDDVRRVAHAVLRHRIFVSFQADAENVTPDAVVDRLLEAVSELDEASLKSIRT
jgi:MoxR-like ATPase